MRIVTITALSLCAIFFSQTSSAADFVFGFSKVEVTPSTPVRLSGYGNRDKPYDGIDEPLFARGMAMTANGKEGLHILVSVDTIGFPGELTKEIHAAVKSKHNIPRSRFVICCTHSHTAPHIGHGLTNLFTTPLTELESAATQAYTSYVRDQVVKAVDQAIQALSPGKISIDTGTATFARNRRVIKDGTWTGFGENPNGPVDHSLPVLRITDIEGNKTRGLIFNYACHCTTFGGDYNRVNGDWAGYATKSLEAANDGAIALCTIGCGADANPERNPEHAFEIAQRQGEEISDEVSRLVKEKTGFTEVNATPTSSFGFAGLPIDRPSDAQLKENLKNSRPQVRRHAEVMIDTKKRMGRLPETYPMPIQVWRFGNEFAMVFLGGEVCVEYTTRIKKELPTLVEGLTPDNVWVTAYANDVFGYVTPERMRSEGGYEVDFSMIYYLQPGRWSAGTEDVILRRVKELFNSKSLDVPTPVSDALKTFTLPNGYVIEEVASEPLIRDPINFAVDARGRLWVVEMGDYPRGNPAEDLSKIERHEPWDGPPAGRIKVLIDSNQDGQYDEAKIFLDGLSFPTGVFPWKDGVFISGAPNIIFARDTDGDLKSDEQEVFFTGFEKANPQHRIGGFEYGLDGWLYLSAGTNNKEIQCLRTGETVNVSGRDCRFDPVSGKLEAISGSSQYGRSRDDFGNWFGNSNSEPLFQFVIEDRDLSRNPHLPSPSPKHHLTNPRFAPQVYPTSRTLDRFNDLFALDRFTSACSPTVFRNDSLGSDIDGTVLICEPVHNLVSRVVVDHSTIKFSGQRAKSEQKSEFLASSDNWFRPTRLMTAPDNTLWVCDMYRQVIEHPEWIPEAWQAKLDLYAGYNRGRIYRVYHKDSPPTRIEDLSKLKTPELVGLLKSSNGWMRDRAQQLILERDISEVDTLTKSLLQLINESQDSRTLIQAAYTYALLSKTNPAILKNYQSEDVDVVISAIRLWGVETNSNEKWQPSTLSDHPNERIRFELALAAGNAKDDVRAIVLRKVIQSSSDNPWIRTAILSSANGVADRLLIGAIEDKITSPDLLNGLLTTLLGSSSIKGMEQLGESMTSIKDPQLRRQLLLTAISYLERNKVSFEELSKSFEERTNRIFSQILNDSVAALKSQSLPQEEIPGAIRLAAYSNSPLSGEDLLAYLSATQSPEVNTAVIESIVNLNESLKLLQQMKKQTPAVQSEIQAILLTSPTTTNQLLEALEQNVILTNDMNAATADALKNHRNKEVQDRFAKLTASHGMTSTRLELVTAYNSALSLKGDIENGKKQFTKTCSTCHRHNEIGNDFGPKLSSLLKKSDEYILTSIIDPNAAAESKYRGYSIVTHNGKVYSGLILEETATSLKLIRPDGKSETILRSEIEEMVNTGRSFMPEGLEKDLKPQDIADIISFLRSGPTP
ncbi:neutral/alkaline non-lysosomal ceramidase N-terminal domain-containing protein [Thalassoglobus sp.]|uniref:neutral/alkaline non-lysosomal ceramidase N-terminal domain-containing protein n=1 Tax=Thalassoglobus sp. TaxID=2795869 RepID=UPI003AA8E64A